LAREPCRGLLRSAPALFFRVANRLSQLFSDEVAMTAVYVRCSGAMPARARALRASTAHPDAAEDSASYRVLEVPVRNRPRPSFDSPSKACVEKPRLRRHRRSSRVRLDEIPYAPLRSRTRPRRATRQGVAPGPVDFLLVGLGLLGLKPCACCAARRLRLGRLRLAARPELGDRCRVFRRSHQPDRLHIRPRRRRPAGHRDAADSQPAVGSACSPPGALS